MLTRLTLISATLLCASAFAATVDPPQRVKITKLDKTELAGMITSYDDDGFELMDAKKQTSKVSWDELSADTVMTLNERLVRRATADDWFKLGKKLLTMPGGRAPAERAFARALKLDPKMKDQIVAARKEAGATQPSKPAPAVPPVVFPRDGSDSTTQPSRTGEAIDPQKPIVGPQQVGPVDPSTWGHQTPEQQAAAVAKLRAWADDAKAKIQPKLVPYETQYFLFYSDLQPGEAQKWVAVLDRMYAKLATLFAIPAGENLWYGKALVFVFSSQEDYLKFEIKMHATVAAGTGGMCHQYGSGVVHIAFYRQPNELDFAHILVHESVHGFLHRYRSPVSVPSWANEGLAEAIASDMVPRKGIAMSQAADARSELQRRKSLDKFFEEDHIVSWQYAVARTLAEFMIQQNKAGYVEFINGIKDGLPWEEALRTKYGVTVDRLVNAYGLAMGVSGLKPSNQ